MTTLRDLADAEEAALATYHQALAEGGNYHPAWVAWHDALRALEAAQVAEGKEWAHLRTGAAQ